jgi:hypothetical protein
MQSKMKFILFILLAFLFYSCASTPEPKDCNGAWDGYDNIYADHHNEEWVISTITPNKETIRGRDCKPISKKSFNDAIKFTDFIYKYHEELYQWTYRRPQHQIDMDGPEVEKMRTQTEISASDDEKLKEMIADLELKVSVLIELRKKLLELDKESSALVPTCIASGKEWLSNYTADMVREDAKKKTLILTELSKRAKTSQIEQIEQKKRELSEIADNQADQENKLRPSILKMRSENPSQWKECKESYKTYIDFIRSKIKANKRIPNEEQKKFGDKMKPVVEPIVVCRTEGYYTESESENIMGGVFCLQYYTSMPSSAKNQTECIKIMKPYSF